MIKKLVSLVSSKFGTFTLKNALHLAVVVFLSFGRVRS